MLLIKRDEAVQKTDLPSGCLIIVGGCLIIVGGQSADLYINDVILRECQTSLRHFWLVRAS